ncbi:ABC transporter permease [Winogradskyella sp.]|uniref:ABC transporter permease n=1 Tax=Winogradskyella sp. TaxID=1883156 RepID=UPI0035144B66
MIDLLTEFPALPRTVLRDFKRGIDTGFKEFSRSYGEAIETFFYPLLKFLVFIEQLLLATPWPIFIGIVAFLGYWATRSLKLVIGVIIALFVVGLFGMWEDTMETTGIIVVSTLVAILIGIPLGILMSKSDRAQSIITPILDFMQTLPPFVYLIPVVMLLGIGKVPGLIAVVIYAVPPVVRLTNLGIREVDSEIIEAAESFGATPKQKLYKVQIPLAMPTIFAGINQTIMMALAMVIIASMIGVKGLGLEVLRSITNQYLAIGLLNGTAIVVIAIIFDRISQAYGKRVQEHRKGGHH